MNALDMVDDFVRATAEIDLVRFLAGLPADCHVVAPPALIDQIRQHETRGYRTLSSEYNSLPLLSRRIYIYDVVPGSPSAAIRRGRPQSTVISINHDLIIDRIIRQHHGTVRAAAKRSDGDGGQAYCIINAPRSGGILLAHLLRSEGLGEAAPHLRDPLCAVLRHGYTFGEVFDRVAALSGTYPTFATQFNVQFLEAALVNRHLEFADWVLTRNVKCFRVRRNAAEQAVSLHFAAATRVWETWGGLPPDYGKDVNCEVQLLHDRLAQIERLEGMIDRLLRACPGANVLTISYNELETKPEKVLREARAFLGVATQEERRPLRLPSKISRENRYMKEALANLLAGSFR